jgi:hypothetical protein
MTQRFKRILFFLIVLGFCISTPVLILYSQGYKYDFENRAIVKTGGLFLKISPSASRIYIDNKLSKKTNFIFGSAFLSGLLPKKYEVKIEKDDYHNWEKAVSIEQQKVTEYKNIQLFLKNPQFSSLASSVENFYVSSNQKEILIKKSQKEGWFLERFLLADNSLETLTQEKELFNLLTSTKEIEIIDGNFLNLLDVKFSSDDKKIMLETALDGLIFYFILEIEPEKNIYLIETEITAKKISFNPSNNEQIFFVATLPNEEEVLEQKLFFYDYKTKKSPKILTIPIAKENIKAYCLFDNSFYWLNEAGFLYKGNLTENKVELASILNLEPLNIFSEANYNLIIEKNSLVLLQEDELLYYLNQEDHSFVKLFASLKEFKISPDHKKISLRNNHEIIVSFLEEKETQPLKKAMERIRLTGTHKTIENLFWLNNYHLIFNTDELIQIIEIDNRETPNLIEIAKFKNPKISWLEKQKTLLVLSNNKLFASKDILQ